MCAQAFQIYGSNLICFYRVRRTTIIHVLCVCAIKGMGVAILTVFDVIADGFVSGYIVKSFA